MSLYMEWLFSAPKKSWTIFQIRVTKTAVFVLISRRCFSPAGKKTKKLLKNPQKMSNGKVKGRLKPWQLNIKSLRTFLVCRARTAVRRDNVETEFPFPCKAYSENPGCEDRSCTRFGDDPCKAQWYIENRFAWSGDFSSCNCARQGADRRAGFSPAQDRQRRIARFQPKKNALTQIVFRSNRASGAKGGRVEFPWRRCNRPRRLLKIVDKCRTSCRKSKIFQYKREMSSK